MLVSSGHGRSYYRQLKKCAFSRNGSFIDIFYEDDGRRRFIGIVAEELKEFLDSEDKTGEGHVNFDEPADPATASREMFRRKSLSELAQNVELTD